MILSKKGKSAGSVWDAFSFCWWKEQERRAVSSPHSPASPSCPKCRAVWSYNLHPETIRQGFPGSTVIKNPLSMQERRGVRVRFLGLADPLQKQMTTHSSVPAWKFPWTEEPGRLYYSPWSIQSRTWLNTRELQSLTRVLLNCQNHSRGCPRSDPWLQESIISHLIKTTGASFSVSCSQCFPSGNWNPNRWNDLTKATQLSYLQSKDWSPRIGTPNSTLSLQQSSSGRAFCCNYKWKWVKLIHESCA